MKQSHFIPPHLSALLAGFLRAAPPETPKRPVTVTYHGTGALSEILVAVSPTWDLRLSRG
jgi:hypothetical protein